MKLSSDNIVRADDKRFSSDDDGTYYGTAAEAFKKKEWKPTNNGDMIEALKKAGYKVKE